MMRWWAVLGGILAARPLARALARHAAAWHAWRLIARGEAAPEPLEVLVPTLRLLFEKAGLLLLIVGVVMAGAVIPLTIRVPAIDPHGALFLTWMAVAWTLWAVGAWCGALAFSANRWLTGAASGTWLVAVIFAARASGG